MMHWEFNQQRSWPSPSMHLITANSATSTQASHPPPTKPANKPQRATWPPGHPPACPPPTWWYRRPEASEPFRSEIDLRSTQISGDST